MRYFLWGFIFFITPTLLLAKDVIDTRITFTIADDNLLEGPTSNRCASPSIPNFIPNDVCNKLFFDDYERRDRGFENLSHLVLYAKAPSFFKSLETEAALVIRTQILDDKSVILSDDGSYIRLVKNIQKNRMWEMTFFPLNSDRFRLGYSYDLSWGGSKIFKNSSAVPGFRLDYKHSRYYTFLGLKTAVSQITQEDGTKELDTVWGVLSGMGVHILKNLKFEIGGGYFYRGIIDKAELLHIEEGRTLVPPWQGYGGSLQLTYHKGIPIGTSIDFNLYKNDPLQRENFFKPEIYTNKISFLIALETSLLGQTLQNPELSTTTVNQNAIAGDISAKIKINRFRVHFLAVYRSLTFILFNVPSQTSFVDIPDGIKTHPELFASTGIDYYFKNLHFTTGFILGAQRPANTYGTPSTNTQTGVQRLVYINDTTVDILDHDENIGLVYALKWTGLLNLSEIVSSAYEFKYSYDSNRRILAQDPNGIVHFAPASPHILGFHLIIRARF